MRVAVEAGERPVLSDEQRIRLEALSDEPDGKSLRGLYFYPPVRLDARVVHWFQSQLGSGSADLTEAVNRVLLDHVAAERRKAKASGPSS